MDKPRLDCIGCRHFRVTWERPLARACRAYGFKSADYPAAVVLRESGATCQLHETRPTAAERVDSRPGRDGL